MAISFARRRVIALAGFAAAGLVSALGAVQLLASAGPCHMHNTQNPPCQGDCPPEYPLCDGTITVTGWVDENGVFHPTLLTGECLCLKPDGTSTLPATECQLKWTAPPGDPGTRSYMCSKNLCANNCPPPSH